MKGGLMDEAETYIFVDLRCVESEIESIWNNLVDFWFWMTVYPSI